MEDLPREDLNTRLVTDIRLYRDTRIQEAASRVADPEGAFINTVYSALQQPLFVFDPELGVGARATVTPPGQDGISRFVERLAEEDGFDPTIQTQLD